jgi:hypothetical protein
MQLSTAPSALPKSHETVEQLSLNFHLRSRLRSQSANLKSLSLFQVIRSELLQKRHSAVDAASSDAKSLTVVAKPLQLCLRHRIHGLQRRRPFLHFAHWIDAGIQPD